MANRSTGILFFPLFLPDVSGYLDLVPEDYDNIVLDPNDPDIDLEDNLSDDDDDFL